MAKWSSLFNDMNKNAERLSCSVVGVPVHPQILTTRDFENIGVHANDKISLENAISDLKSEYDSIKKLKPRIIDNFDALNKELEELSTDIIAFEAKIEECNEQLSLSKSLLTNSLAYNLAMRRMLSGNGWSLPEDAHDPPNL